MFKHSGLMYLVPCMQLVGEFLFGGVYVTSFVDFIKMQSMRVHLK